MIVTFGEVMLRVAPQGFLRFRQSLPGPVDVTFGGGEANVAASLAMLGRQARFVTALPKHAVADAAIGWLAGLGVDSGAITRREGRLGIYFLEPGANQLASAVIYDRAGSAIGLAEPEEYAFAEALEGATRVHVTGITPALSENAFRATLALVQLAHERGCAVSCDLNFRKKLWKWRAGTAPRALARECMERILPHVDLVIANEEDAEQVLGISAAGTAVEHGRVQAAAYEEVARRICERFANVTLVGITLRESLSASHNNWGGMLYDARAKTAHFAPLDAEGKYRPYEIRDIVDRVGAGDSFAAGLLYALDDAEWSLPAVAIRLAVAASCLKHSIPGDVNYASLEQIRGLAGGQASGRVER